MIKVIGESSSNTANFLNSKLTNSFSEKVKNAMTKKLSPTISVESGELKEACLVTSRGKIIDKLTVLSFDNNGERSLESYVVTSPGHYGSKLFDRLDAFIFPLDGVKLHDMCPTNANGTSNANTHNSDVATKTKVFTVIATNLENVQSSLEKNMLPILNQWGFTASSLSFPKINDECLRYVIKDMNDRGGGGGGNTFEMLLYEQTMLTKCCCSGYTIAITERCHTDIGSKVWGNLIDPNNFDGPVELGPLEWETLRIEAGVPAFGHEMTGGLNDDDENDVESGKKANASPLELYLDNMVDETKGCYQGQESIAAQLNNKRGVPRNLYSVIFPEEDNFFDYQQDEEQYSNHPQRLSNKTKQPKAGMDLYVLGSNEEIKVGTLTSVAEKDGTSNSETVALALIRRSDSILKKMEQMGIEKSSFGEMMDEDPFWTEGYASLADGSGMIQPPSLDKLDGLEVVLSNSFTQGYLRPLPGRRLKDNMFETDAWKIPEDIQNEPSSVMGFIPQDTELNFEKKPSWDEDEKTTESIATQKEEQDSKAKELDLEAKRKEEKMEMLKKRAEEAMKRRLEKSVAQKDTDEVDDAADAQLSAAEAEAERKEKKMQMLKEKAEAAMKRRQEKKS